MKKMTVEAWKKCPVCGKTENQVRAGYNESGSQRCKCKECGKYYTINPKQHTYPEETRKLALLCASLLPMLQGLMLIDVFCAIGMMMFTDLQ